mgnify:CR=1 FL=1
MDKKKKPVDETQNDGLFHGWLAQAGLHPPPPLLQVVLMEPYVGSFKILFLLVGQRVRAQQEFCLLINNPSSPAVRQACVTNSLLPCRQGGLVFHPDGTATRQTTEGLYVAKPLLTHVRQVTWERKINIFFKPLKFEVCLLLQHNLVYSD